MAYLVDILRNIILPLLPHVNRNNASFFDINESSYPFQCRSHCRCGRQRPGGRTRAAARTSSDPATETTRSTARTVRMSEVELEDLIEVPCSCANC